MRASWRSRPNEVDRLTVSRPPRRVEGYLRVSWTFTTCVRPPLVPEICRVYVPVGEPREVDTFIVTLVPLVGFGVKEAVVLLGKPPTVKLTDPANPLSRVIVTA